MKAVNEQIPSPFEPLANITAKFTSKGLDIKDVVVLSGSYFFYFLPTKPSLYCSSSYIVLDSLSKEMMQNIHK